MTSGLLRCVVLVVLGSGLAAQDFVSPTYYADFRGSRSDARPFGGGLAWSGTTRYQQIHADLRGVPMTIRRLDLRQHQNDVRNRSATVDFELLMGDATRLTAGYDVEANYVGTPQVVLSRRTVNLPPTNGMPQPWVEPWNVLLPLDAPYVHSGQHDLAWEARTYGRTGGGTLAGLYPIDYAVQSNGYSVPNRAQSFDLGPACGGRVTMNAPIATLSTGVEFLLQLITPVEPADRFGGLLLGLRNPQVRVPAAGCIDTLYTDAASVVVGAPDAQNRFMQSWTVPWVASMADGEFFVQGVSFQAGGLATLRQGLHVRLPPGPSPTITTHQVMCSPATASLGIVPALNQQVIVRFCQ